MPVPIGVLSNIVTALMVSTFVIYQLVSLVAVRRNRKNSNSPRDRGHSELVYFSSGDRESLQHLESEATQVRKWFSAVDDEGRPLIYFPRREFRELTEVIKANNGHMVAILKQLQDCRCRCDEE